MNKVKYYANLLVLPVYFVVAFTMNMCKLTKQAWRWTVAETKSAYKSNRRCYGIGDDISPI